MKNGRAQCSIAHCNMPPIARGWCPKHYRRWRFYGHPEAQLSSQHGMSRTPVYRVWAAMIQRCTNPNDTAWTTYGGNGIEIDDPRWFLFPEFYADMGDPPPGMTLERKKNNRGYSKTNCIWATQQTQANNRISNRRIRIETTTLTLHQWCRRTGVSKQTVYHRLKSGWPIEKAVTTPPRRWIKNNA